MRLQLGLLALGCCAGAVGAVGVYGRRRRHGTTSIPAFSSSAGLIRRPSIIFSLRASQSSSSSDDTPELASSSSFGTAARKRKKTKHRRFTISPQVMNSYTKLQLSKIFGSSSSNNNNNDNNNDNNSGGSDFVPLSLAGRWSAQATSNNNNVNNENQPVGPSTLSMETILLSSPDECQAMAEWYEQYLLLQSSSNNNDTTTTLTSTNTINALPIPLPPSISPNAIKLLSQTYSINTTPLSKSVLLTLNSLFLNRDGGLFDNLPWSTWSVDPDLMERDAANNVVDGKYTMGKRVAYQRFMGKDWQGRSLSLGNLANRIKYLLERSDINDNVDEAEGDGNDNGMTMGSNKGEEQGDGMMLSLSQRLLQLEIKEAQMEVAECEQRLAISKTATTQSTADSTMDHEAAAEDLLEKARERYQVAESSLEELTNARQTASEDNDGNTAPSVFSFSLPWINDKKKNDENNINRREEQQTGTSKKTQTLLLAILVKLTEQENPPPYRGAIGYPAKLDTKKEVFEESIMPYSSPYELLLEVIDEQLNSEVMACVLEPTSLLEGNLVLGGALLLRRKGVEKSTTLSGEVVSYTDDDDSLGNEGVLPRSMYVVECFSDEAIGMAMASNAPIFVEEEICNRAGRVPVELDVEKAAAIKMENSGEDGRVKDMDSLSFANRVPLIRPSDESYFSIQLEGEKVSSERDSNSVRIPLTTNPELFGADPVPQSSSSTSRSSSVFSTFNPVKTLDEYDELTDDAKARLLLKLESFSGYLPRPRAVQTSTKTTATNSKYDDESPPSLLDDILIPLVDESIRRQYLIRDAERRKSFQEADALRAEVSPRQVALENAQVAREEGLDDEARRLEEEADLYKALRADVTQDEGS
ncbi:hypothetical protein ACHAXR_012159 [Thalassiosira sp. AJA248-18]